MNGRHFPSANLFLCVALTKWPSTAARTTEMGKIENALTSFPLLESKSTNRALRTPPHFQARTANFSRNLRVSNVTPHCTTAGLGHDQEIGNSFSKLCVFAYALWFPARLANWPQEQLNCFGFVAELLVDGQRLALLVLGKTSCSKNWRQRIAMRGEKM